MVNLPASARPPKVSKLCAKTENIQSIGDEIAIQWTGGKDFLQMEMLRAESPSAENKGESDLLGNRIGGTTETSFPGIRVTGWEMVGGYAIQFRFSDGHNTGAFQLRPIDAIVINSQSRIIILILR